MKKSRATILSIVVIVLGIYTCVIGINSRVIQNPISGMELELCGSYFDGGVASSEILNGSELTIVYLWNTEYDECITGVDDLISIANEYNDSVKVVGYLTDGDKASAEMIINQENIGFKNIILDDESKEFVFNYFYDVPLVLFLDADGLVLEPFIEIMVNYDEIKYLIDELLVK